MAAWPGHPRNTVIPYPLLLTAHLFAALMFVGAVFFEVLILGSALAQVSAATRQRIEAAIARRARRVMPWVLAVLYASGLGMAWHYRMALAQPLASRFALLLTLKIALALSVLGHFAVAMATRGDGPRIERRFRRIHHSVFCHMLGIVLLAKAMFHLS
ncbi:CopD family copper resistance protein [Stenotrophomonas sp. Y-13]|uniref:CopD family copper resistance protein n=1 Tax=Stenotrophomonas sp. Y-13 TaxID=3384161 RepID=UPI0039175183